MLLTITLAACSSAVTDEPPAPRTNVESPRAAADAGPVVEVAAPRADSGSTVEYRVPVDAPIVDHFRPPPQPWLPGNRGVEFATVSGTPVRAAGRGIVRFAGSVAGSLHVTITHPDRVRTSYSFLAEILVREGEPVRAGQVIGVSGARLHVGARRGGAYIDPESLWGRGGPPRVRLVPLDGGA